MKRPLFATSLAALALLPGCRTDLENYTVTYKDAKQNTLHVFAQQRPSSHYRFLKVGVDQRWKLRGLDREFYVVLTADDKNTNGIFDEDEIRVESLPVPEARQQQDKGIMDYRPLFDYANSGALADIWSKAVQPANRRR